MKKWSTVQYVWITYEILFPASPTTAVVEPMETDQKVEVKNEKEASRKKKKRSITWATDDKLVEYHYYEPDDEERGN